ncbi:MAG TPA: hypothetical protein VHE60_17455 [Pyrinomonadaceae bacterium]|nr:hypothetical protein [Pyrinomonadaceae bacterium]
MFQSDPKMNERLDRAGRTVLRAAACDEAETEAAASSPFLFTRVRAAIAEEQRRREEASGWLSIFFVARQAVPAMALVTLLAAILTVWSTQVNAPAAPDRFDEEAFFDTRDTGVEQTILANRNGLSGDEVFSIVVDRNEREKR